MEFLCLFCGKDSRVVAFSCKSKLCLRCGRVKGEKFGYKIKEQLHPDINYRHVTFTIPKQVRIIFYQSRQDKEIFNQFMNAGWKCVEDFVSEATGRNVLCGGLVTTHFVGRTCEYKPHLHFLIMDGGIDKDTGEWVTLGKFPYVIMHRSWKKHLLAMLKNFDLLKEWSDVIELIDRKYKVFVARIEKSALPKDSKPLIEYISKYLCRPQISQKRIKKYSSKYAEVEFEYRSHKTGRREIEEIKAVTFIGRMMQQIPPKGLQNLRYFGLQSVKNRERTKRLIDKAIGLLGVEDSYQETIIKTPSISPSYRDLVILWWGSDPMRCKHCGNQMELVRIWHPIKGFVFNLFEQLFGKDTGPPVLNVSFG